MTFELQTVPCRPTPFKQKSASSHLRRMPLVSVFHITKALAPFHHLYTPLQFTLTATLHQYSDSTLLAQPMSSSKPHLQRVAALLLSPFFSNQPDL